MGKPAVSIELTAAEWVELEGLAGRRRPAQGLARRAWIVLAAAAGLENQVIARTVGADENTVGKWRRRFAERRLNGLHDEPRPGAPRRIGDDEIAETIRLTLESTPPDATHWSLRSMAAAVSPRALDHPRHLEGVLPAAASQRQLQAVDRPAVCREDARYRRPLPGVARARCGAVRRREITDPGA